MIKKQQSEPVCQASQWKRKHLRGGYHGPAGTVSGDPGYRTQHFPEAGCAEMIEKGIGISGADTWKNICDIVVVSDGHIYNGARSSKGIRHCTVSVLLILKHRAAIPSEDTARNDHSVMFWGHGITRTFRLSQMRLKDMPLEKKRTSRCCQSMLISCGWKKGSGPTWRCCFEKRNAVESHR